VIALVSGGGSAAATLPVDGISLSDIVSAMSLLLRSGETIRPRTNAFCVQSTRP
jgi:glycerate-2-kinase